MFCENCGKKISDDSVFCEFCGKKTFSLIQLPKNQEHAEKVQSDAEKQAAEQRRLEAERLAAEQKRLEAERIAAEQKRLETERRVAEQKRLESERRVAEQKRFEAERIQAENAEKERAEQLAIEKERLEHERKQKAEAEEVQKKKIEKQKVRTERQSSKKGAVIGIIALALVICGVLFYVFYSSLGAYVEKQGEQAPAGSDEVVSSSAISEEVKGITLSFADGKVLKSSDDASCLLNCAGVVVKYDGEVVTDYKCDVNGHGTNGMSESPWFKCERDENGKLYLWALDQGEYKLTIKYGDETETFCAVATEDTYKLTAVDKANYKYFYAFSWNANETDRTLKVFFDNKQITDYDIIVSDINTGKIEKLENGKISVSEVGNRVNIVTIKYGNYQRSYCWWGLTEKDEYVKLPFAEEIEIKTVDSNVVDNQDVDKPIVNPKNDSGSCGENATYTFDAATGLLTISGMNNIANYSAANPAPWYSYRNQIKNVVIEEGITYISDRCFCDCTKIKTISFPSTLVKIGYYAFHQCKSLKTLELPASIQSIGNISHNFSECNSLESITVSNGNEYFETKDGVLFNKGKTTLYLYPAAKKDASYEIPNTVTYIIEQAFLDNPYLESIYMPASIKKLDGPNVASNCNSLKKVIYAGTTKQYFCIDTYNGRPIYSIQYGDNVQVECLGGDDLTELTKGDKIYISFKEYCILPNEEFGAAKGEGGLFFFLNGEMRSDFTFVNENDAVCNFTKGSDGGLFYRVRGQGSTKLTITIDGITCSYTWITK